MNEMKYGEPDPALNDLAYWVIGAAMAVHRIIGPGYLESVYEEALAHEFDLSKISYLQQSKINIIYKSKSVGEGRLDFLVEDKLVVELKAVEHLAPIHQAQVMSYLKTTRLQLGRLINFNVSVLKDGIQKMVLSY